MELNAALLDLMRRLPPQNVESNLGALVDICPDQADDLLSTVDQPLKIQKDAQGKEYLACDYNRDGDSYRSPWNNEYDPPLDDGTVPSDKLRKLEVAANDAFNVYREMYFEGGVSSVYFWDLDDGFAGVVLLKKSSNGSSSSAGLWDSIHVFETNERSRTAHYKLTSTVMLHMQSKGQEVGELELAGSMTRQTEQDMSLDPTNPTAHVANIGKLIEDQEFKMRNLLQEVYFAKTRDVVNELRSIRGKGEDEQRRGMQSELVGLLRNRA